MIRTASSGTITCGVCHQEEFLIKTEKDKAILICATCGAESRLSPDIQLPNADEPVTAASQGVDLKIEPDPGGK
jgi:transcription elongation factor Elf1